MARVVGFEPNPSGEQPVDDSGAPIPVGVWGDSDIGVGVFATSTSPNLPSVLGRGVGSEGVRGESGSSDGVHGEGVTGVLGRSLTATGVQGISLSEDATSAAVRGDHPGPGRGVLGVSGDGTGVFGASSRGVGVVGEGGSSTAGVSGFSSQGFGVRGFSDGGIGIVGESGGGSTPPPTDIAIGVSGVSPHGFGVRGITDNGTGVIGEAQDGNAVGGANFGRGIGCAGSSNDGTGVQGDTVDGTGVIGRATGSGTAGLFTTNNSGTALKGSNAGTGPGITAVSGNGTALFAWGASGGTFIGDVEVIGNLDATSKSFVIDHPLDPANRLLAHASIESSERANIYSGNVVLDQNGEAWVLLPEWFEALNEDFRYQLTCLGGFGPVYVAAEISDGRFLIAGGDPGLKVSWQVTGIRKDPWARSHRFIVEDEKPEAERGHYRNPELFGQGLEGSTHWARNPDLAERAQRSHPELLERMREQAAGRGRGTG